MDVLQPNLHLKIQNVDVTSSLSFVNYNSNTCLNFVMKYYKFENIKENNNNYKKIIVICTECIR